MMKIDKNGIKVTEYSLRWSKWQPLQASLHIITLLILLPRTSTHGTSRVDGTRKEANTSRGTTSLTLRVMNDTGRFDNSRILLLRLTHSSACETCSDLIYYYQLLYENQEDQVSNKWQKDWKHYYMKASNLSIILSVYDCMNYWICAEKKKILIVSLS